MGDEREHETVDLTRALSTPQPRERVPRLGEDSDPPPLRESGPPRSTTSGGSWKTCSVTSWCCLPRGRRKMLLLRRSTHARLHEHGVRLYAQREWQSLLRREGKRTARTQFVEPQLDLVRNREQIPRVHVANLGMVRRQRSSSSPRSAGDQKEKTCCQSDAQRSYSLPGAACCYFTCPAGPRYVGRTQAPHRGGQPRQEAYARTVCANGSGAATSACCAP